MLCSIIVFPVRGGATINPELSLILHLFLQLHYISRSHYGSQVGDGVGGYRGVYGDGRKIYRGGNEYQDTAHAMKGEQHDYR